MRSEVETAFSPRGHRSIVFALLAFLAGMTGAWAKPQCANPACIEKPAGKPAKPKREKPAVEKPGSSEIKLDTLESVIRRAIAVHPQIGIARSRALESSSVLDASRAGLYPQLDVRLGGGHGVISSTTEVLGNRVYDKKIASGSGRVEGQVTAKQLLFDFGARSGQIGSAEARRAAAERGVREITEDVAYRMADAFLRVLEAREVLAISEENVIALDRLRDLVEQNEQNGNSTAADVKRIQARISDARTGLADAQSEAANASDKFRRLVQIEPGPLKPAPLPRKLLPTSAEDAVGRLTADNPKLRSLEAAIEAARRDVDAQRAADLPLITLDADFTSKSYAGRNKRDEIDGRALLTFRKNLLDGGLASAQLRQAYERLEQAELQYRYVRDETEADIRQAYRSILGARQKSEGLQVGVETSGKARELYDEQFSGGKRTLFELLDIQSAYFTARRSQIVNRFEEHRSAFTVLRTLGILTAAVIDPKNDPPPSPPPVEPEAPVPDFRMATIQPNGSTPE